jgi:hypothetical protein
VLVYGRYGAAAREIAAEMGRLPPLEDAVGALAALAKGGSPAS